MSITYQFGGAPEIERIARTVLPDDDPLQVSEFFSKFADGIRGVCGPEQFERSYSNAGECLPPELHDTLPSTLRNKLLLALCHDDGFISTYAYYTEDWSLLTDRPADLARLILWPPDLWGFNLVFYSLVWISSFVGAIAIQVVGPSAMPTVYQFAQVIWVIEFLGVWLGIMLLYLGWIGGAFMIVIDLIVDGIAVLFYPGGKRRLKTIERIKRRRELRAAQRVANRELAQADPRAFLLKQAGSGLAVGLCLAIPIFLVQSIAYQMGRANLSAELLMLGFAVLLGPGTLMALAAAYIHHLPLKRLLQ